MTNESCTQEALIALPILKDAFLAHQKFIGNYAASTAPRRLEIYTAYRNSEMTLEQLGTKYGVSRQRIWQIVKRLFYIMKKLNEVEQNEFPGLLK